LLDGCAAFAASRDAKMLLGGVSTARHDAYRVLLARGFRVVLQGIAMHRPNEAAYSRPDRFVIDDWR
jgi:molybdopterin biosynthesis enzyme